MLKAVLKILAQFWHWNDGFGACFGLGGGGGDMGGSTEMGRALDRQLDSCTFLEPGSWKGFLHFPH